MKHITNVVRVIFLVAFIFLISKGKMMLWLALFAVSLIVALIFGRIYCGYICPMNTLMGPVKWLSKKLKLQTDKTPMFLKSGKFPWFALVGSVVLMIIAKRLLHKNLPILLIWLIVSAVITLRYKPSIFHNLICPFGVLQKAFGKRTIFSKKVNKDSCIGCKLCEKTCPSNAITVDTSDKKADINTALCLQCTNCQQVCPKSSIFYMKQKKLTAHSN